VFGFDEGDAIAREQMRAIAMKLQLELVTYLWNFNRENDCPDMQNLKEASDISRRRTIEVINDMCLRLEQAAPWTPPTSVNIRSTGLPLGNFSSSIENEIQIIQDCLHFQATDTKHWHWPVEASPWPGSSILPRPAYMPPTEAHSPETGSSVNKLHVTLDRQSFGDLLRAVESIPRLVYDYPTVRPSASPSVISDPAATRIQDEEIQTGKLPFDKGEAALELTGNSGDIDSKTQFEFENESKTENPTQNEALERTQASFLPQRSVFARSTRGFFNSSRETASVSSSGTSVWSFGRERIAQIAQGIPLA
jgi:hypothetical protein